MHISMALEAPINIFPLPEHKLYMCAADITFARNDLELSQVVVWLWLWSSGRVVVWLWSSGRGRGCGCGQVVKWL